MKPTRQRAREALRSADFRRLFAIRLVSQSADGLFQAALVASIVFNPEEQSTVKGFAIATLLVSLPFSILGPFTGVFIDRWSRRAILVVAPVIRAGLVFLVLFDPDTAPIAFYGGALLVLSINRFYLATAVTIVPRLVPTEDLLMANSMSTVGGTVALLLGVFVGGWIADLFGDGWLIALSAAQWLVASAIASRISTPLVPHHVAEAPVRDELRRVLREFGDGVTRLSRTPRAFWPIGTITLDQMGQGIVLVLSLFVFRDRFESGVGSFSNLIGAGGLGVLLGILTVGKLEERFPKERIVAGAFLVGGLSLIAVSLYVTGWSVLLASFAVGLTFAWKKIPVDTMVQEAVPDGYRGRVFAVYDVAYNLSRVVASFLAIPMLAAFGEAGSVAIVGIVFLLWSPVLPRVIGRIPELTIRFYEGARAEEEPRAVVWGGVEESVEVERRTLEETDGVRRRRFRLRMQDGTVIDVVRVEPDGPWALEREVS
ncbi:MAG TPA: MFS transporter [Actinomycetota bacterium]|jgi:MFS family permease|nr:MFS transporter [Actinomycetota bacterium]